MIAKSIRYVYAVFFGALFFTSCNGQSKTTVTADDSLSGTRNLPANPPKMIRTQGVSSGNVGCGLEDKNGNLWFATGGEGVYVYDGKSFTAFSE